MGTSFWSRPPTSAAVESAPDRPTVVPWALSAKSPAALCGQADRLRRFVEAHPDTDPVDVGYSLVTTRAAFDHRAVALGASREELMAGLAAIAAGTAAPDVVTGRAGTQGGTVFVFPGQGSQWAGMAIELLDTSPAFADEMRLCQDAFAEFVDWSLLDVVRGGAGAPSLDRVDVVQPVLFAVMVSLAAQWRALGVHPDAVIGHSQGEIAAAYVAGALSLRDAAKVVTLRSKAIRAIAGTGGMVSVPRPVEQVHALIEPWGRSISVAAQNGPSSMVVSGERDGAGRLHGRVRAGRRAGRHGSPSTTLRTPLTWRSYGTHCAGRWPGCRREQAISRSSPRSPAPGWTRRPWTATTGSPTCAGR